MEEEELRRIGFYADRMKVAGRKVSALTAAERLELRELLKKWMAEVEGEPITVRMPSGWGDVRKTYEA